MNETLTDLTLHPLRSVLADIDVNEKLVNGNQLLILYYGLIFLFFLIDFYIVIKTRKNEKINLKDLSPIKRGVAQLYYYYRKYGYVAINAIVLIICDSIIIYNLGFEWTLIIRITLSIVVFTIFMKLFLRIFINRKGYENESTIGLLNAVCYIILGNFFCYNMSFISAPDLKLSLSGLTLGLLFCLYIMLIAIFNPEIIQKSTKRTYHYSQAFGIMKGMVVILICLITTLYMMVYCCFRTNPGFYATTSNAIFDEWDLLYYLIISFTTIGYGDIVPLRYNNLFYSRYVAIVIGLSSLFTTTCFVAAIISSTNSLAQNKNKDQEEINPNPLYHLANVLTEDKFKNILNDTLKKYSTDNNDKK